MVKRTKSPYNLRSSCDGSCEDSHDTSHSSLPARSRPKTKRQPKKAPSRPANAPRPSSRSRVRRSPDRRSRSSSSTSYSLTSSSHSSTRRPRRKKSARRDRSSSSSLPDTARSFSLNRSRRSLPHVTFNLSANSTVLFSTSSPAITASPAYISSPSSGSRERNRSPVIIFPPVKEEPREESPIRAPSPPLSLEMMLDNKRNEVAQMMAYERKKTTVKKEEGMEMD